MSLEPEQLLFSGFGPQHAGIPLLVDDVAHSVQPSQPWNGVEAVEESDVDRRHRVVPDDLPQPAVLMKYALPVVDGFNLDSVGAKPASELLNRSFDGKH
jgi:hypothetical protein